MINKYAGTCGTCGDRVSAGAGQVVNRSGHWQTYHDGCVPVRAAPPPQAHGGWHHGTLVALDLEATSAEPLDARIISAALVHSDGSVRSWLIDPGTPIPPDATAVNGLTDEMVRRNGRPAAEALAEIGTAVAKHIADGTPLVAFRAPYDVTLLHAELARYGLPAIDWVQASIVDPYVLHRRVEPDWYDRCTLGVLCGYYEVDLTRAHEAAADAEAALHLARSIAARHRRIADLHPVDLHEAQTRWYAEDAQGLRDYYRRKGIARTVNDEWPLETARRG